MKNSEPSVPKLNLTPRLKRPLSLLNPLDYLRILYWSFFFPQVFWWYINKFGKPEYYISLELEKIVKLLHNDPVQRNLIVHALITALSTSFCIAVGLSMLSIKTNWVLMVCCLLFTSVPSCLIFGIGNGVVFGVVYGVASGVFTTIEFNVAIGMSKSIMLGAASGVFFGFFIVTVLNVLVDWCDDFIVNFTSFLVITEFLGVFFLGVIFGVFFNCNGIGIVLGFSVACGLIEFRLPDYLITFPGALVYYLRGGKGKLLFVSRSVFLSLPGIQKHLENWLIMDWEAGVYNANQVLNYSWQFIPVVKAVNAALENSPKTTLLSRISILVDNTLNWKLIRFCSASFKDEILKNIIYKLLFILRLRQQNVHLLSLQELRLDNPTRSACAGFWFWHENEAEKAVEAFATLLDFPHGSELYKIAQVVVSGNKSKKMEDIKRWEADTGWLDELPDRQLRPGTIAALRKLRASAADACVIQYPQSPINHSMAITRASKVLSQLIETVEKTCPYPEWPLIKSIAEKWREIVIKNGGEISKELLRQPVPNPYEGYSGFPVTGSNFVGRTDIIRDIEKRLASSRVMPPLILYGHRFMGKSSILRNLERSAESNILIVYVDMQNSGWVNHSGELMLDLAEKIHCVVSKAGLDAGPLPSKENYLDIETATHSLETLFDRINSQMEIEYKKDTLFDSGLTEESSESATSVGDPRKDGAAKLIILAIDEFERIEAGIKKNRIDQDLLLYLRYIKDKYKWLGLIFAGLHSLSDKGRDKSSTFYGQAQYLHVGYLTRNEAFRLITHPHPDFALEYDPDLCEELYRLTNGQPYLIQCLCWKLVTCWNERFRKEGESTPRMLSMEDLNRALTLDFYHKAGYYFEGVWSNVNEKERQLMLVMAEREGGWSLEKLKETCLPYLRTNIDKTCALLRRHDVIKKEKSDANGVKICFASELMRRWVLQKKGEKNNDH